jgi:hypothetical protein
LSNKIEEEKLVPAIESFGHFYKIEEMFESYSGWYWFTINKNPYPDDPDIRYGYVIGFEKEWGTFSMSEINSLDGKVWPVPKSNWSSNSNVTLVPESKLSDMTDENEAD